MEKDLIGEPEMGTQKLKSGDDLEALKAQLLQRYAGLPSSRRDQLVEMHLRAAQLVGVPVEPTRVDLGSENASKEVDAELFQRTED